MTLDALVGKSFNMEGYENSICYDASHRHNYGFYICKVCLRSFFVQDGPVHREGCSLKARSPRVIHDPEIVFVFGPNESGISSPIKIEDIEKIKELAKQRLLQN